MGWLSEAETRWLSMHSKDQSAVTAGQGSLHSVSGDSPKPPKPLVRVTVTEARKKPVAGCRVAVARDFNRVAVGVVQLDAKGSHLSLLAGRRDMNTGDEDGEGDAC